MNSFKEQYLDQHLSKRMLFALFFAVCFITIGWLLPDLYYRFLDNTQYYTVIQPIPVDQKWYKPCDDVILTTTRTALLDFSGKVQTNLLLKQGNDVVFRVPDVSFNREISVKAGSRVAVSFSYPLPCKLADGLYYWQLTLVYKVKGYDHEYTAVSDTFNVNKYGLDPEVIKEATSSAQLQSLITPRNTNPAFRQESMPTSQQTAPSQGTTVINNNNSNEAPGNSQNNPGNPNEPQPKPKPVPTPIPSQEHLICLIGKCVL